MRHTGLLCSLSASVFLLAVGGCGGTDAATGDDDVLGEGGSGAPPTGAATVGSAGTGAAGAGGSATTGAGASGTTTGGMDNCNTPQDCPGEDSTCLARTCENNVCGTATTDAGTACTENAGNVCDGQGSCVECLSDSECDLVTYCEVANSTCADKKPHEELCGGGNECLSDVCTNGSCCGDAAGEDHDNDGFTVAEGDCNDCDPNSNPGALDVVNVDADGDPLPDVQQVDENCDGTPVLPTGNISCDDDPLLTLDSSDPVHAAMALDLCQVQQQDGWGIVSAEYVQIDGQALPANANVDLGHGIVDGFGTNVAVASGTKMLMLSTGAARQPSDTDYQQDLAKSYTSTYPTGVPFASNACPTSTTGSPFDSVALSVDLKAPTNAKGFSFQVKFYTREYPTFVCSSFNDLFLATMDPAPMGAAPIDTGNVTFDSMGEPLSINNAFFDVCEGCPSGATELDGTGYEGSGATTWLTTSVPVEGGDSFTMRFGVMDAGDAAYASSVLLDNFSWDADPGIVITE